MDGSLVIVVRLPSDQIFPQDVIHASANFLPSIPTIHI